ncbi:MAG: RidA family protein [Alphaproteobacteria bacterium]|nr:RidA family protein [Alphaproteobacteria bacterium]
MARQNVSSGRPWEASCGFSRAVRIGNVVEVSLTTPTAPDGSILYPNDVYRQTRESLRIIEAALAEAGASLSDVIRTAMYLKDMRDWEAAGRAHGEVFGKIRPVTGWIGVSGFFTDGIVAEVSATAIIQPKSRSKRTRAGRAPRRRAVRRRQ